ncbi:MAG: thioredoxin [Gammaproteobacteria bacterium]|nr:thioredoxin [Gammaproteobacteria bacterium]
MTIDVSHPKKNDFIFDIDLHDFESRVLEASADRPVLVDFWADWCGPCLVIAPVLTRVVESYEGAVHLAKLEVDEGENMKLAGQYKVRGFPTIILFEHGKEVAHFSGVKLQHQIEHFIDEHASML